MPLRQVRRTPKIEIPPTPPGVPYGYAIELRPMDTPAGPMEAVIVLCPWCGDDEATWRTQAECPSIGRRYTVAIPAGTAVMA